MKMAVPTPIQVTTYFDFRLTCDRPIAHRWWRLHFTLGDHGPITLHHRVGDPDPPHYPALVQEAGSKGVGLVVGDSLPMVDAAVQGEVDTGGQNSHDALR